MKKVLPLLLGLTPVFIGAALEWLMTRIFPQTSFPLMLIGVAFLVLWATLSRISSRAVGGVWWGGLLLLLPAVLARFILLFLYASPAGLWAQMFYLPVLRISALITPSHSLTMVYSIAFLLLNVVTVLTYDFARRAQ